MLKKIALKLLAIQIEWQWIWIIRFRKKLHKGCIFSAAACERIKKREEKARSLQRSYENLCGLTELLAKADISSL